MIIIIIIASIIITHLCGVYLNVNRENTPIILADSVFVSSYPLTLAFRHLELTSYNYT